LKSTFSVSSVPSSAENEVSINLLNAILLKLNMIQLFSSSIENHHYLSYYVYGHQLYGKLVYLSMIISYILVDTS